MRLDMEGSLEADRSLGREDARRVRYSERSVNRSGAVQREPAPAARIRTAMDKRGWSANQLADFAGVARGFLSELLAGKKSPSLRTLAKIAAALDVSLRDLVPDTPTSGKRG